jgi:hypothetical protein
MRRTMMSALLAAALVFGPATAASATHTGGGCEHQRTTRAHEAVPHRNQGTHQAHQSIPYCPPHDAPRHRDTANGHGGHH